ncbi:MAG: hypothetical protein NC828_03630, partial [Candidatus Omnitrophica bacterium]|nr:hypothetical protein [Candidatus Omnitrophota bacterium]
KRANGTAVNIDGKVLKENDNRFVSKFYEIRDEVLYGPYGNIIAGKGKFTVDKSRSEITIVATDPITGKPTTKIPYEFLLENSILYKGSKIVASGSEISFSNSQGQLMVKADNGELVRVDGEIVRGNYIGIDFRRDPFELLFREIIGDTKVFKTGTGEQVKYAFVIDEDTSIPPGSIRKMIAKMAHPDNAHIVLFQPALKNTNAYDSMFTQADTWGREILRFNEFTNWRIFGGITYGKFGVRIKEYVENVIDKEIVDPTARSEDERPPLYVPAAGLVDVAWGDEPKRTFFQFVARMQEWTIGDIQTLLKEYLPRMLWGIPNRIYAKLAGKDPQILPKLSPQGQKMLTNLWRSVVLPPAFGMFLLSGLVSGVIPSLFKSGQTGISTLFTMGVVLGSIFALGKWIAPQIMDMKVNGFDFNRLIANMKRGLDEALWSTGLYIPMIYVKSLINFRAMAEIRRADRQARMVPRTPGVVIEEMERVENLTESYRKLLPSPIIGAIILFDLLATNPSAALLMSPIIYAFTLQPTLAFLTEKTTVALQQAIKEIEKNPDLKKIGDAFKAVYSSQAQQTMADEKLGRLMKLSAKFERSFIKIEENPSDEDLIKLMREVIWDKLTDKEREVIVSFFSGNTLLAMEAVYNYLKEISIKKREIEIAAGLKRADYEVQVKALMFRSYMQALIRSYPNKPHLEQAAMEIYTELDKNIFLANNITALNSFVAGVITRHRLSVDEAKLLQYYIDLAKGE